MIIKISSFNENIIQIHETNYKSTKAIIGIIGAGEFTSSTLLPNLNKVKSQIKYIASAKGLRGTILAKNTKFKNLQQIIRTY